MRTLAMGKPHSAVLSAFVAFALAFTLIPLPAYAEEVEANPTPDGQPTIDENAVKDDAADNLDENKYTVTKLDDEQAQERVNVSVSLDKQEAKAPASSASEEAKAEPKKDASALITQDGLTFQVISDTEVAFVGGAVNTNKLVVPSTVKGYTVTAVACTAVASKDASAALAYIQKAEAVAAQGVSKAVETIVIPKTVTSVDAATLAAYPNAKSIQVAKGNKAFTTVNGMLFSKDKTILVAVPEGLTGTAKLPSSLIEIPDAAFARAGKVTAIALDIGECAYATYEGALYTADKKVLVAAPAGIGTSIKTAKECTTIIEGALFGITNLKTIIAQGELSDVATAPEADVVIKNVKDIAKPGETISPEDGKSGFAFTLTDDYTLAVKWTGDEAAPAVVNVPDYGTIDGVSYTVTALADNAFDRQKAVETVNIPNTVNTIGKRALAGTSLKSIVINSNITTIEDEAFAELDGTNIVVVNAKPVVAESATKASENLNIYTPYVKSGEYGWKTGLPATGNHICPYGVKFASSVYSMKAGETVDLYAGNGYWLAPGAVVTNYSYKAKYVSVDPTTGKITAKQNGSSALDVTLSIKVEETTETGTQTRDISLEPAAFGNANNNNVVETGSVQRVVAALGDTATVEVNGTEIEIYKDDVKLVPAARMAMVTTTNRGIVDAYSGSGLVNVEAPSTLVFSNSGAGVDIASDGTVMSNNSEVTTLTATGRFKNKSAKKIKLVSIKCNNFNNDGSDVFSDTSYVNLSIKGDSNTQAKTITTNGVASEVKYNLPEPGTSETEKAYDCTFTLKIKNGATKSKLDKDLTATSVGANSVTPSFGQLVYVFSSKVVPDYTQSDLTSTTPTTAQPFVFKNNKTQTIYNLETIIGFSEAITEQGASGTIGTYFNSLGLGGFKTTTSSDTSYECWALYNGVKKRVVLLGVGQDVVTADPLGTRKSGDKAGFTFAYWDEMGDPTRLNTSTTDKDCESWGESYIRNLMNKTPNSKYSYTDYRDVHTIYYRFPASLRSSVLYTKQYYAEYHVSPGYYSYDSSTWSSDQFFMPEVFHWTKTAPSNAYVGSDHIFPRYISDTGSLLPKYSCIGSSYNSVPWVLIPSAGGNCLYYSGSRDRSEPYRGFMFRTISYSGTANTGSTNTWAMIWVDLDNTAPRWSLWQLSSVRQNFTALFCL